MEDILASRAVGISELKANLAAILMAAELEPVAILNRTKLVGYIISPAAWESTLERLDDIELSLLANARLSDGKRHTEVSVENL
jgi:antitoxin StbD